MKKEKNNSIIMVPYANDCDMQSSVNIKRENRFDIYMKNCCVALLSAKHYNKDSDVALITNTEVPIKYKEILEDNGILIISAKFNSFRFPNDYKWGLAFYKLCALKYMIENYEYDFYSYMDADVYIQSDFANIWKESQHNILLYDINHGLQVKDYNLFLDDIKSFTGSNELITHYGGEFFAASKANATMFISECGNIFEIMHDYKFYTRFGDEFIVSLAAVKYKETIKNAGAYVFRFWTGDFRLVSTQYKYNSIAVIHVPDEKGSGILKIFSYITKHNKLPKLEHVYSILHLKHRKLKFFIKQLLKHWVKK